VTQQRIDTALVGLGAYGDRHALHWHSSPAAVAWASRYRGAGRPGHWSTVLMAVPSLDWSRHTATDLLSAHNNLDHVTLRVSDITRQRQVALVSAHPLPALETQVSAHRPAAFRYHRVPCRSYVDTLHAALANRNEKYVARTARKKECTGWHHQRWRWQSIYGAVQEPRELLQMNWLEWHCHRKLLQGHSTNKENKQEENNNCLHSQSW